ncbi:hypothetical protein CN394_27545 [Bacillus anthracis]|nr:hypothetical protein CN394_27545 [Bacillus anthracis]
MFSSKGNQEEAIRDYTKAIELKPDYAQAHNNRGLVFESKGNQEEAIRDYTKAIELKPDYALAYYNRGIVFNSKGNQEEAIKDFTMAIGIEPQYGSKLDPIIKSLRASLDEVAAERDEERD